MHRCRRRRMGRSELQLACRGLCNTIGLVCDTVAPPTGARGPTPPRSAAASVPALACGPTETLTAAWWLVSYLSLCCMRARAPRLLPPPPPPPLLPLLPRLLTQPAAQRPAPAFRQTAAFLSRHHSAPLCSACSTASTSLGQASTTGTRGGNSLGSVVAAAWRRGQPCPRATSFASAGCSAQSPAAC